MKQIKHVTNAYQLICEPSLISCCLFKLTGALVEAGPVIL